MTPSEASASYGSFFPALHLRYRLDPSTNARAAVTRTIARPDFLDLAPNEYIRFDDEVIRRGNPNLTAATSTNLDLLFERYFASVGMFQAGLFYKAISDFAYLSRTELTSGPQAGFELLQPENGADATVYGAELAWQQRLAFLPGALNGLGVYTNYTWTKSETDFGVAGGRATRLPEQFNHVANVALTYDMFGFSGLVSANYQSNFVDQLGSSEANDRFGDSRLQIDANHRSPGLAAAPPCVPASSRVSASRRPTTSSIRSRTSGGTGSRHAGGRTWTTRNSPPSPSSRAAKPTASRLSGEKSTATAPRRGGQGRSAGIARTGTGESCATCTGTSSAKTRLTRLFRLSPTSTRAAWASAAWPAITRAGVWVDRWMGGMGSVNPAFRRDRPTRWRCRDTRVRSASRVGSGAG